MFGHRFAPLWALFFVLFARSAQAEFGAPYVTPSQPVVGETILVNVPVYRIEYCEGIVDVADYPRITRDGNAITILFNAVRFESLDELCVLDPGLVTRPFGSYPKGSYSLTVQLRYGNEGGEWVIETLGVVSFTIRSAESEPVAVPTWNRSALFGGVALLLVLGTFALREGCSLK